jgi:ribosomal protein L35AE/L33A
MKGVIVSHRRGKHSQVTNQFLLEIDGVSDKATASKFIGKSVIWTTPGKREIHGKVSSAHGNSGTLRVRFPSGVSSTMVGKEVEISE